MSFRKPVLDRRHRPRWQDELRSQQLIVAGFALAIAVAIGIFGAAAWISYYDANLRQVALVGGTGVARADVVRRLDIVGAELTGAFLDLQSQLTGGMRDSTINQQLQSIQTTAGQLNSIASDSLLTTMVLDRRAAELGISLDDAQVDAEVAERTSSPERRQVSIIVIDAKVAEDAEEGSEPTDADFEEARQAAEEILAEIRGGEDFGTLAAERSDDPSKEFNGILGWLEENDPGYADYYDEAGNHPVAEVAGPIRNATGYYLIRLDARKEAGRNELLAAALANGGINDAEYREYVRGDVLSRRFRTYFSTNVVTRYQPQRKVAQIFLAADQGTPVPKQLVRHLLVQPLPGEQDQSTATDEEWEAALTKVEALRAEALKPDVDWIELGKQSDDPGSKDQGGRIGWYSSTDMTAQLDPAFAEAALALDIGEISETVRSSFGYHIIQLVEQRTSAIQVAERLVAEAREDPDSFTELVRNYTEAPGTIADDGDLGWILHYEYDATRDEAIFALTEPDQVSEPVESGTGIYIFKLLEAADQRFVLEADRRRIANSGFTRWLTQLKDEAGIWIDPEFAAPASTPV